MFVREMNYRDTMIEKANENLNIITGGEGYCYLQFMHITGKKTFIPFIYNDFDYPIHTMQVHIRDVDKREKCEIYKDDSTKRTYIDKDCDDETWYKFQIPELPPKSHFQANQIEIPYKDLGTRYMVIINARNGVTKQRVFVNEEKNTKYFGYKLKFKDEDKKPFFHNNYQDKFEWDFDFKMEEYYASDLKTIKKLQELKKKKNKTHN